MTNKIVVVGLAVTGLLIFGLAANLLGIGLDPLTIPSAKQSDTVGNTESRTNISDTAASATRQTSTQLEILTICRGVVEPTHHEACASQFRSDGESVGLGEPVTIILNSGEDYRGLSYRFDGSQATIAGSAVDMHIAHYRPGGEHFVQILDASGRWSERVTFGVELLKPLNFHAEKICAGSACVPDAGLIRRPQSADPNNIFPLVEYIVGPARTTDEFGWMEQQYLWVELMLDGAADALGCINCRIAKFNGYEYPVRLEFGDSGIFYNWDLMNLDLGDRELRVRGRNEKYTGEWSEPFRFRLE